VAACGCGWQASGEHPPTEAGEEDAVDQWMVEHAEPELARQATRRHLELARMLEWLGSQAGRLHDPATLARVARGLEQARGLLASVQRDLERSAPQREADHGR
jgi:hypothetical protein